MTTSPNPYQNPDFVERYVNNQISPVKNMYEWEVTNPAMLQCIDGSVRRILDYGTGSGVFAESMARARRPGAPDGFDVVGTDASAEILKYAEKLGALLGGGVHYRQWDANIESSTLQDKSFDRIFAKLVFNYLSGDELRDNVLPRLRECLTDDGLLIATLPNPLREAKYSRSLNEQMERVDINVGNFSQDDAVHSHHHTFESMMSAASGAGFTYGAVVGLPEVRFEPYRKGLMRIAHPMPMILDTINAAKRWVYVFGATESSLEGFDTSVARLQAWRSYYYPEIADRAHIRVKNGSSGDVVPISMPHDALYDYMSDESGVVVAVRGRYAERLTPRQKIRLVKKLAAAGTRGLVDTKEFLVQTS